MKEKEEEPLPQGGAGDVVFAHLQSAHQIVVVADIVKGHVPSSFPARSVKTSCDNNASKNILAVSCNQTRVLFP